MVSSGSKMSSKDEDTAPPLGHSEVSSVQHPDLSHVVELRQGPEKGAETRKLVCGRCSVHVLVVGFQSAVLAREKTSDVLE